MECLAYKKYANASQRLVNMSLFKHTYSGLITNGLGLPACCGLLTMGFGVFKCTVEIYTPPIGGGGGGPYVANGFYVPLNKQLTHTTKLVIITVKMKDHTWKKSYVVDRTKAKIVVNIVNLFNAIKRNLTVGISTIKRTTAKVMAVFDNPNK